MLVVAVVLLVLNLSRIAQLQRHAAEHASNSDTRTADLVANLAGARAEQEATRNALAYLSQQTATAAAVEQQRFDALVQRVTEMGERVDGTQREVTRQLEASRQTVDARLSQMTESTASQLHRVSDAVERQLTGIRSDTNTQLDRMRATVDEKLQKTLNERITQSFALVNESLDKVGRGLGEMQSLAADVGGLKRTLAGVKTRGILGEIQLGAILKEMLAPGQYEENKATVPGSANRVEFAVKLPGEAGEPVWLPIDSKFPGDSYEHLRDAQEAGDTTAVDAAWRVLETRLKQEAKDIRDKYLEPPATTSFGILFLPFEGLYAEVASRSGLLEELQRTYHVNVAGPSTMAALLNSLQMGFQTVAIQQRASEIQTVLAAVKTEFGTYQKMLRQAQKQLGTVSRTVDTLVGTRSRAMERKLRSVTELDDPAEAARILGIGATADAEEPIGAEPTEEADAPSTPVTPE